MPLDEIEIYALTKLFCREDMGLALRVRDDKSFKVLAREKTSAGFYSIIHSTFKARFMSEIRERSWSFDHPLLSQRGVFVCWVEDCERLCLEAFCCSGEWPDELLPGHLI